MTNLPPKGNADSMDNVAVTREQFRQDIGQFLEFSAQALGNVTGTYTTAAVDPLAVVLQGAPKLAAAAEPAASDSSLRLANTAWVKKNGVTISATAPTSPSRGQLWVDTSQDPPIIMVWDNTPAPGAWVEASGGASVEIAAAPPAKPTAGDMWWNSDDGRLYIYYTDANSSQWVDASPDNPPTAALWERTGTVLSPVNAGDVVDIAAVPTIPDAGATNARLTGTTCKAWVNFKGTGTVSIRGAYNVSSVTDNSTGYYTVRFTTPFVDANYSAVSMSSDASAGTLCFIADGSALPTASALGIRTAGNSSTTDYDPAFVSVAFFR